MRLSLALIIVMSTGLAGCAISPKPLTELQISDAVDDVRVRVVSAQEPLNGPVSLYEAMARALKYNLDKEVEVMDILLREQQLRVAHHSMLPELVAEAGYADRTNYSGGSSVQILGPRTLGQESLTASTSSERDVRTANLKFSWHILDFGLSFVRARQSADRVLIADEKRRKVVNNVVEGVRAAYWRAVSATRLRRGIGRLGRRVERALADTRALATHGVSSPLKALTYERELVEIQREIRRLDGDLSSSKAQLAALINVDPGKPLRVKVPSVMRQPRFVGMDAEEMVMTALSNRSELRDVMYQERINAREAEAAILEMLPGISLDAAPNWNSNKFLFNNNWVTWGAQTTWNLIKVFSYPQRRAVIEAREDWLDAQVLAVTMAIMTQVQVARARLIHARRRHSAAQHYKDVQSRILDQIQTAFDAGKVSEQTAIREEMNTLVATVKLDLAYAELQGAFAALYASMGLAPYADLDHRHSRVDELRDILRASWRELGDRMG